MPLRIIITHKCNHEGPKLPPIVDKYWDTTPENITRVCHCLPDGEKAGQKKMTPMVHSIEYQESKPE